MYLTNTPYNYYNAILKDSDGNVRVLQVFEFINFDLLYDHLLNLNNYYHEFYNNQDINPKEIEPIDLKDSIDIT